MDKRKCVNGHFFNLEKFEICPICGGKVAEEPSGKVIWEPLPPKEKPDAEEATPGDLPEKRVAEGNPEQGKRKKRWGIFQLEPTQKHKEPETDKREELSIEPSETVEEKRADNENEKRREGVDIKPAGEPETGKNDSSETLSAAIAGTRAGSISALPKTQKYYEYEDHIPPVGWLVCVAGAYTGQTFECRSGNNRIGRNVDFEINLEKEPTVSREAHAILIYEPRQRKFFLKSGTGSGLVYLNDNLVMQPQELHGYDRIAVEKAEFVFVPLCGEQFTWDDYLAKN
ncbi:MAG: FHA domain-containing protein [Lachnospiraceae bacterium]|nr:FHA domain-containing protein [Lachnospiraceae bacterium]